MTDERVSDERLQELVELADIELAIMDDDWKDSYRIKEDKKIYEELLTLRQQNKELLADAERLAEELSKGWSEMSATETHMTLDKHNALIETIAGK